MQYPKRVSRLKDYDYSSEGAYFMTMCTHGREPLYGKIVGGQMVLNEFGKIVQSHWDGLADHYAGAQLDAFVVMPNHIHGIIIVAATNVAVIHEFPLQDTVPQGVTQRRNMLIPKMVGRLKMNTAKQVNEIRGTPGVPVWQRNYWEHVIRDEDSLNRIREYIINNPLRWELDRENLNRVGEDEFDRWLNSLHVPDKALQS